MYVFHILIELKNEYPFPFSVYLHNEWMFYTPNLLTFQWKKTELVRVGWEKEGGGVEGKVCDFITHNMQFNPKCQMIS